MIQFQSRLSIKRLLLFQSLKFFLQSLSRRSLKSSHRSFQPSSQQFNKLVNKLVSLFQSLPLQSSLESTETRSIVKSTRPLLRPIRRKKEDTKEEERIQEDQDLDKKMRDLTTRRDAVERLPSSSPPLLFSWFLDSDAPERESTEESRSYWKSRTDFSEPSTDLNGEPTAELLSSNSSPSTTRLFKS